MHQSVITRLAPTPSGLLHLGNAFNFILTSIVVNQHAGSLRLRIDDMDEPRINNDYLQDIFDNLNWLGIHWQHGPKQLEDHLLNYQQHLRLEVYQVILEQLVATGLVFACNCSRISLAEGIQCACKKKNLPLSTPETAWRLNTSSAGQIQISDLLQGETIIQLQHLMPDFVIRRKDGLPAYQVVSLADDLLYHTTTIVRGLDLMPSSAAQIWMAQLLRYNEFCNMRWFHHGLFIDANNAKLSKSSGSTSLQFIRKEDDQAHLFYQNISLVFGIERVNSLSELQVKADLNYLKGKAKLNWPIQ